MGYHDKVSHSKQEPKPLPSPTNRHDSRNSHQQFINSWQNMMKQPKTVPAATPMKLMLWQHHTTTVLSVFKESISTLVQCNTHLAQYIDGPEAEKVLCPYRKEVGDKVGVIARVIDTRI